ncbi:MAG TPA: HAMP domain-containing histidine kinase [Desulfobacteraceae bacterium]|nr:HAMP domain-containing histidine kinase [Desulfobacteraceae bacterium]
MNPGPPPDKNGPEEEAHVLDGTYDRIKAVEEAHKALLSRKRITMRLQIYVSFLLVFLFAAGIAVALITTSSQVARKLRFLEITNEFTFEIIQARRFEKNFFLYGTNLQDALDNVSKARETLRRNEKELKKILGDTYRAITTDTQKYQKLLEKLSLIQESDVFTPDQFRIKKQTELGLRKYGAEMVTKAQDLIRRERAAVSKILSLSRTMHVYSLVILLIFLILNASFLGSRILGNTRRFSRYAQRIASGDFTPITPAKRYQDEFTDMAIALNQMILELENREAVLVQSHKMRAVGTLTAGVAHELNNPLNNITITAHMLLEDYESLEDDERKDMIQDMINESGRSKKIISNLLDFARESSSQMESLDLTELLQETIALASNQIKLSGIKIEFQATDNLPRVHGDIQQLEQVFLNLILNAVDASSKGDRIQVIVLPADDPNYVAVKVIDSGSGIPEHILPSIFDPFFTTKGKGKGTGLGLSVSQGIVAKHGGRISVSSKEGQGTTFTVTLPITTIPARISA